MGEVVVKVPHHVQEAQRDAVHHLPGRPPGSGSGLALILNPRNSHIIQGEDVLVPGVPGREVLHGVEMTAGAQHLSHVGAEVLQDSGEHRGTESRSVEK